MLYFNTLVIIFVLLILIYILVNLKIISPFDITLLAISAIVLLITILNVFISTKKQKHKLIENFSTKETSTIDIPSILAKYTKVDTEEDISDIQQKLCIYLTAFNKKSFNSMGKVWFNIANIKHDGTCPETDNTKFNFDLVPAFSRTSGFYLGNNRIIGPLSNALDIQFHNTYTIILTCKHGNLLVDNKNQEIELLKLYANSPNNNGLSIFIEKESIHADNNTQVGSLLLQYADHTPYECLVDKAHNFINLDKDVLTFYFIVKDTDNVRVLMMTEGSTTIHLVLKFTITNTDVTFSNKEILINRLLNWNSTIYNLAIYDKALSDENVSMFYSHIMKEYLKNLDPNFNTMLIQYNDSINLIQSLLKCPYNKTVASQCPSVKSWCDINQVINAPLQCRKSINDYCANNTSDSLCKCWDTSSSLYNSDNCKIYRSFFSGEKNASFDGLTTEDLEYIKKKYGLIWSHECPTTITKPKFVENTYNDYDWNKLKVYLDPKDKTTGPDGKILNIYPDEEGDETTQSKIQNDDTLDWENRKIKGLGENNKATNLQSINNILSDAKKEQADLLDLQKGIQTYNKDISTTIDDIYASRQQQPQNSTKPTPQVTDQIGNSLPPPDTFFSKFMKVMIPTSI